MSKVSRALERKALSLQVLHGLVASWFCLMSSSITPASSTWDRYGRWGIDLASATTTFGFQVAKTGTKFGVSRYIFKLAQR